MPQIRKRVDRRFDESADRYSADTLASLGRGRLAEQLNLFSLRLRQGFQLFLLLGTQPDNQCPFDRIGFVFDQRVKAVDIGLSDFMHTQPPLRLALAEPVRFRELQAGVRAPL